MPTYTFTRTREQMRDMILRRLGVLEAGQTADNGDSEVVYEAMNLRLKELHRLGVLWWQVSGATTDVTLTGGNASATISATDFLFPVTMAIRVGVDDKVLEVISHREYQAIPNKADQGEPEVVFVSGSTARFWPTPDINYTAKLTYEAIAADLEQNTAPDIEVASMRSFALLVAGDLVDDFGLPEGKAQRLLVQQPAALATLRTLNTQRVTSTTVESDYF